MAKNDQHNGGKPPKRRVLMFAAPSWLVALAICLLFGYLEVAVFGMQVLLVTFLAGVGVLAFGLGAWLAWRRLQL